MTIKKLNLEDVRVLVPAKADTDPIYRTIAPINGTTDAADGQLVRVSAVSGVGPFTDYITRRSGGVGTTVFALMGGGGGLAAYATGTITVTTTSFAYTVTVAGYGVSAGGSGADYASTDAKAAAIVAAINANSTIRVTAAAVGSVITLTAKTIGAPGNEIFSVVNVGTTSGATLTGGADGGGSFEIGNTAPVAETATPPLIRIADGIVYFWDGLTWLSAKLGVEAVTLSTPTTGQTITALPLVDEFHEATPAGALAAIDIVLPSHANSRIGQVKAFVFSQNVTTATVTVAGGGTFSGTTLSTIVANEVMAYKRMNSTAPGRWRKAT